ncbi:MFS efflux transporter [Rhodotorula toruloides]|uniref:MFS efflux transporter n=1 Tax=Rhodotorula toruloides TaxID=5286 RepID=A0A511KLC6_RHOTO|nr:MFS efflux transporter [Rhodotorula toruloides]
MIALVGMNDSATGANLDSMQAHYGVSYDEISIVFLANTAGYFLSSISASFFLHHFGLQVSLLTAAAAMSTGCVVLSIAPPFPAFIIMLGFMGFGSGMYDAVITTVIAHEEDGVLMSLLYSCFGVGAMISPLAIGAFLDRGYPWNRYYNIPLGLALILAVIGYFVFRGCAFAFSRRPPSFKLTSLDRLMRADTTPPDETHDAPLSTSVAPAQTANTNVSSTPSASQGEVIHARARMSAQQRMRRAMGLRAVWIGFVLIICAFASSDILSAWSVSFLISTRNAPPASSRFVLSGLWMGIASGRVVLAWLLANRVGEKTFAIVMLVLASGMLGVMYVRSFVVDAVALALVGFFFGPVTPKVLDVIGVRVPPSLKASVVSLLVGLGLIGSSVGPLLFGVAAGRGGLSSLPAVLIGVSVLSIAAWCAVPKNRRRED